MKRIFFTLFLLLASTWLCAQDESWKIFDDSHIPRVDITIHPDTLKWIYEHVESETEHLATFRFRNAYLDETFDSIGFRLRGNTSREAAKKSFKVSFNTFIRGRDFLGIEKLNLNGEHNDPSIIRSKLCCDLFHQAGIIASRANHVKVYINGNYYGLYINVEHIDEEFIEKNFSGPTGNLWKCLYPADLNYLGSSPALYQNLSSGGRPVYELKTNEEAADFSQLARFIRIINLTPLASLPDSLENIADVGNILSYFAMDVLLGSWDDYRSLMNNYYLYYSFEDGKFMIIPYDYDNTFGIDWFNVDWAQADPYNWPKAEAGFRPLADRLLQINQYHDLYSHFLEFYSQRIFELFLWDSRLTELKSMINSAAEEDFYRTLDYGFTIDDFHQSYSAQHYANQHVKNGLREFVNLRNSILPSQIYYTNAPPIVYSLQYTPHYPLSGDSVEVNASIFASAGIKNASLIYKFSEAGQENEISMSFSPDTTLSLVFQHDNWKVSFLTQPTNTRIYFKIKVTDSLDQTRQYPLDRWHIIQIADNHTDSVRINELMASNVNSFADPAGEYDDWIELYNFSNAPQLLSGHYLSDKPSNLTKWKFPAETIIPPHGFLLVWCDEDEQQPGIHSNFKLNDEGESLIFTSSDGITILDSVNFGYQSVDTSWGRIPDGVGEFRRVFPTPNHSNSGLGMFRAETQGIKLELWPNPLHDITNLVFEPVLNEKATLSIFDISGRKVYPSLQIKPYTSSVMLNLSHLQHGIYILRIESAKFQTSERLIIQ